MGVLTLPRVDAINEESQGALCLAAQSCVSQHCRAQDVDCCGSGVSHEVVVFQEGHAPIQHLAMSAV